MTYHVLFVQGGGAHGTHDEWDSKLVESLAQGLGTDCDVRYPRMPNEADPEYAQWRTAIEKELDELDDDAILIGHSIGGTILVNALAELSADWTPSTVFLIAAPFVGEDGWPSEDIAPMTDIGARLPAHMRVHLYHGSEDETVPFAHAGLYGTAIPRAVVHRLTGRDHQLNNDLSEVAAAIRQLG